MNVSGIAMTECDKSRKELLNWQGFEMLAGLILHGSDGLPCDGEGIYQKRVLHVQTCESCRSWLKDKVPANEESRLSRLEKYCCPVMFGSVEQKEDDALQLRLINFQGDATWAVMNFDSVGGNLLISYCPWCGSKMPNEPFIDNTGPSH